MTLGELRAQFSAILSRRDMRPELATTFIKQGISRLQRQLRAPCLEKLSFLTPTMPASAFDVPADLLEIKEIVVNGEHLEAVSWRRVPSASSAAGQPRGYTRVGPRILLHPPMAPGGELILHYYGEAAPLTGDTSANELTAAVPDLVIYAALSFAGDFFMHDSQSSWEARFQTMLQEALDQAQQLEFMGGSMALASPHGDY